MALPTATYAPPPAGMAPTAGVGATPGSVGGMRPSMTGVAQTPETKGAEPVLFDDLDPVLLARLYPASKSGDEARSQAMAAGAKCHEDGLNLVASQQELVAGTEPSEPPAPEQQPPVGGGWRPPPLQTPR